MRPNMSYSTPKSARERRAWLLAEAKKILATPERYAQTEIAWAQDLLSVNERPMRPSAA